MTESGPPALTVLIVTWNGWRDTRRCLKSILESTASGFEVLVIDNASRDGTPEKIEQLFPSVRLIRNADNLGHTHGVNQGVRLAHGEHVLVLDSDTELAPDSIGLLLDTLESHPKVGLVAPRTYNSDGSIQPSARQFPSAINGLFGRQSVLTRLFPRNRYSRRYLQTDALTASAPYEVEQVSSACMLFRRPLFASVGPWDESYPGYWVDSDWCFRVRKSGWRALCVPQASVVHHEQNRAGRKKSWRRIWMFHYGAYRFYRKTRTFGALDPRALAAFLALTARGTFQLAQNVFLTPQPDLTTNTDGS
jgi:GT2 family glycosyltransferase